MWRLQFAYLRCYEGPVPPTTQEQPGQLLPNSPQSNHLLHPSQFLTTNQTKTPCVCWPTQGDREGPSWHRCRPQEPGRWEPCPRYTRRALHHPLAYPPWPRRSYPSPPSSQSHTTRGPPPPHGPTTSHPSRRHVKLISAPPPAHLHLPPCPASANPKPRAAMPRMLYSLRRSEAPLWVCRRDRRPHLTTTSTTPHSPWPPPYHSTAPPSPLQPPQLLLLLLLLLLLPLQ